MRCRPGALTACVSSRFDLVRALTSPAAPIASGQLPFGAFVYRSGHGPLKAERRVRFPYALPLKINYLRKSAGKVQEDQVASAKSSAAFPLQISFGEEFFNPAGAVAGK